MFDFALTEAYAPFTIAFLVMCGIGLIEAIGLGIGALDLHADIDADGSSLLQWLGFGEDMPILIWLTSLLACFVLAGFGIQQAGEALRGAPFDPLIASGGAVLGALVLNFFVANLLHRILPREETTAIRPDELVGLRGTVLESPSRRGRPVRTRVTDRFGQVHYVMVEPHDDDAVIPSGRPALLVRRDGPTFYAVEDDPLFEESL